MFTKEESLELLQSLVAVPSEYFKEDDIMYFVYNWLNEKGIDAQIFNYTESVVTGFKGKNIIHELKGGQEGPTICLNGHLDTVKLCNGWTKNPYGELDGNKFYGVGALDMKAGCAALMLALVKFKDQHPAFKGKIKTTFASVEEGPYGMGINALIESGFLDDVDFSICAEPSAGFTENKHPDICLGARGGYGLSIEIYGKSAHAANPQKGISAIEEASKLILELKNINYIKDEKLGTGDCCVIAMESDGGACSVPDFATIKIFWHTVVGENKKTIINEINKAAERAKLNGEYKIKFREAPSKDSEGFLAYTVPEDNEYIIKFKDSIKNITKENPTISYFQSIGDFCYLGTRINAPIVIFGPDGKNYHEPDEYVNIDSYISTANIIYDFLEKTLL